MTTSDGDLPVGETVDIEQALHEVTGEASAPDVTVDETAVITDDAASVTDAPEEPADAAAPQEAEEVDPAVALKADLRAKPGDWYVIHSYAGYENKVKANLETRVQNLDVGDYIVGDVLHVHRTRIGPQVSDRERAQQPGVPTRAVGQHLDGHVRPPRELN